MDTKVDPLLGLIDPVVFEPSRDWLEETELLANETFVHIEDSGSAHLLIQNTMVEGRRISISSIIGKVTPTKKLRPAEVSPPEGGSDPEVCHTTAAISSREEKTAQKQALACWSR